MRTKRTIIPALAAGTLALNGCTRYLVHRAEAAHPPAGRFVVVDGVRLHYVEHGAGRPVVLIHGDGGSVADFTLSPLFAPLTEGFHVLAFDRPGFGYSDRAVCALGSPLVQAALLHNALARLGIHEPILVGHSRGGAIALAYALRYPDAVAAVVALAPGAYPPAPRLLRPLVPAARVVIAALARTVVVPAGSARHFALVAAAMNIAFEPKGTVPPSYLRVAASMFLRPCQIDAWAADVLEGPYVMAALAPRYPELRPPLVIVQGEADRSVAPEVSRRLLAAVPGSRLVLLPGAGHMLQFGEPRAVLDAIRTAAQ
jgi:pimeloyl-ACP methyl ester carboxylesterase